ncbi:GLP_162_33604_32963 [Cryptosporidium hominis TU502]|uniref:GLP_162_33604_32963 n=1 Tax=Cryptosporidium hominis (strain TU502) TaxID=353151 RepID=UPI00004529EA|nr:GLP_162_33604_32963 [Cryptosporidium hominis TU502]
MLEAYQDKSAYAMTLIGYYDETKMSDPIIFKGKNDGEIVKPRGEKGFSWDPIFNPMVILCKFKKFILLIL